LNAMPAGDARAALLRCCGSQRWAEAMTARRPFASADELLAAADEIWSGLGRDDWLEAFAAHPRIGDVEALRKQFAATAAWSAGGVAVVLSFAGPDGIWAELARGVTDADGRLRDWLPDGHPLRPGDYQLWFATGDYFAACGVAGFYPEVRVRIRIDRPGGHYH